MCVRIFGFTDPVALERADDLGLALQLTNILRDVREDAVDMGRIYLPQDELARFGIPESALLDGEICPGWQRSDRATTSRARASTSRRGYEVLRYIPRRPAACVQTMAGIYEELLKKIERDPGLPLRARAALSKTREAARRREVVALERVAVVGAGLAGLAAALELKDAGRASSSSNAAGFLGGRATSFEIDGVEVDNGQHVFLACCTEFIEFARRVGMERAAASAGALRGARSRARRPQLAASRRRRCPRRFICSVVRNAITHLDAARESSHRACARRSSALSPSKHDRDETFEAWLQRNGQGAGERRAFWDPFFIPALNAPFDRVAAADAMFVLRTAFLSDPGAARFGFSNVPLAHLAAAAARTARRRPPFDRRVSVDLERSEGPCTLRQPQTERSISTPSSWPCRRAKSQRLLGDPARYGIENLDAYDPYPIVDVHLWHDGGSDRLRFCRRARIAAAVDLREEARAICAAASAPPKNTCRMPTAELEALAWSEAQAFLPELKTQSSSAAPSRATPKPRGCHESASRATTQHTSHPRSRSRARGPRPAGPTRWNRPFAAAQLAAQIMFIERFRRASAASQIAERHAMADRAPSAAVEPAAIQQSLPIAHCARARSTGF